MRDIVHEPRRLVPFKEKTQEKKVNFFSKYLQQICHVQDFVDSFKAIFKVPFRYYTAKENHYTVATVGASITVQAVRGHVSNRLGSCDGYTFLVSCLLILGEIRWNNFLIFRRKLWNL